MSHVCNSLITLDRVRKVWEDTLGISLSSDMDTINFFQLGGNSIQALKIISELKDKFNLDLSLRNFLLQPTIKDLSAFISS